MKKILLCFSLAGLTVALMKKVTPEKIGKGTTTTVDPPGEKLSFTDWCKYVNMSRQWFSGDGQISTIVNLSEKKEEKTHNII